ncbi:PaaI family thioesterase [Variovorax sp. VNK109]|uniref:PaaI family thioesterase n=1 Tax=Variovorax sp. VNK109 TaxID=3400919 RepID=UPI003C104CE5
MSQELVQEIQSDGWKPRDLPGFISKAGPLWARREGDNWVYGFLVDASHMNSAGVLHGGAVMTLMDQAISTVAWEASGRQPCVTLQLDTHFLAGVREGQFAEARATVSHRTRGLIFMNGQITVDEKPVATALAIMKVLASPKEA